MVDVTQLALPRASRRMRITALVLALAGVVSSGAVWSWRRDVERREFQQALLTESQNLHTLLARDVAAFFEVLDSIRQLHTISERISDEDFREFVEKGMRHQRAMLHAFGFAQSVPASQRQAFEDPGSENRARAPKIVERAPDGSFRPAGDRNHFFPLTYETPDGGLGVPKGYDLTCAEAEQAAIVRMMSSGSVTLGGRGWGPDRNDYLALAPILYMAAGTDGQPTSAFLMGFACGLFRPGELLAPVLQQAASRGLELKLIDGMPSAADIADPLVRLAPVQVADRLWTLRCVALPAFSSRYHTPQPLLLLLAGWAVTALVAAQLLLLARNARSVELAVKSRTADLSAANARLEKEMAERRRLEQEVLDIATQEKQRVGRDLHDSLGQKLTGAVYLSRALAQELGEAGASHGETAGRINEILKEAVAQSRRIARGLSPVDLSEGGLAQALRHLAADTSAVFGIQCTFHGDNAPALPAGPAAANLYQIAQEAINNAVRHGQATEITVLLEGGAAGGELVVEDNGIGLAPEATQKGGMGLRIMRYRAGVIGGELRIERGREGGTVVECRFPVA